MNLSCFSQRSPAELLHFPPCPPSLCIYPGQLRSLSRIIKYLVCLRVLLTLPGNEPRRDFSLIRAGKEESRSVERAEKRRRAHGLIEVRGALIASLFSSQKIKYFSFFSPFNFTQGSFSLCQAVVFPGDSRSSIRGFRINFQSSGFIFLRRREKVNIN